LGGKREFFFPPPPRHRPSSSTRFENGGRFDLETPKPSSLQKISGIVHFVDRMKTPGTRPRGGDVSAPPGLCNLVGPKGIRVVASRMVGRRARAKLGFRFRPDVPAENAVERWGKDGSTASRGGGRPHPFKGLSHGKRRCLLPLSDLETTWRKL